MRYDDPSHARCNRNPAVREQAFFWLGQSEDPRALEFLAEVLKRNFAREAPASVRAPG